MISTNNVIKETFLEGEEDQYFSSMFRSPAADTIEECIEKFLRDEASIDSYING